MDRARAAAGALVRSVFTRAFDEDFVVTGIPRSGTSLLSVVLSTAPRTYVFNEMFYDYDSLPLVFARQRLRLATGSRATRVDEHGRETTDTMRGAGHRVEYRPVPRSLSVKLGSNVNVPYMNAMLRGGPHPYRTLFAVRSPYETITSWRRLSGRTIPESLTTPVDRAARWPGVPQSTDDLEQQALIWDHYAKEIARWQRAGIGVVVRYESLTGDTDPTVRGIEQYLRVPGVRTSPVGPPRRRPVDPDVRAVVADICTSRGLLGYE